MNLDKVHEEYGLATAKASEVARQLAFAGIAVVWLFSGASAEPGESLTIKGTLLWAGLFLVLCLAFDFLHAAYRAASWGIWARRRELQHRYEDEDAPGWMHYPSIGFFWGKLVLIGAAYTVLAVHLVGRLS